MFKNKILMRAQPPSPFSSSPFLLIQLSITYPSSLLSVELETLCCKLSRKWRLACFRELSEIFIIYQRVQSDSSARVIMELVESLSISNVGAEEEVESVSLIARAIECVLRYVMLDNDWRCVGDKLFVESSLACSEERNHIPALNVAHQHGTTSVLAVVEIGDRLLTEEVQLESDDSLIFLISPDVVRFNRYKISELLNSGMMQRYDDGKEVTLDAANVVTACTTLPYLYEGHVTGLSKALPAGEKIDGPKNLWLFKYGLALPSTYFVQVELRSGGDNSKQWYPSSFVLQGSGLTIAPHTIRALKAMHAVESFIKTAKAWNFFDRGLLIVKDMSSLDIGSSQPVWETSTSNMVDCKMTNNSTCDNCETATEKLLNLSKDTLNLDFRTPKPYRPFSGKREFVHADVPESAISSWKIGPDITKHSGNADILCSANKSSLPVMGHVPIIQDAAEGPENAKLSLKIGPDITKRISTANIPCSAIKSDLSTMKHVLTTQDALDCAESGCVVGKMGEKQSSDEAYGWGVEVPKFSRKKEMAEAISLTVPGSVHSQADTVEVGKRAKPNVDRANISTKVITCYIRGDLQSLTVADLKCFLSMKKAKVGGKKEELIQRISTMLA